MINPKSTLFVGLLMVISCTEQKQNTKVQRNEPKYSFPLPSKNQMLIDTAIRYGPEISSSYEKAVCTEFLIQVIEKIQSLSAVDKKRIRIITEQEIQALLRQNSPIPKGVYFTFTANQKGRAIDDLKDVLAGDLVQFWYESWGHCGIVKSIDPDKKEMYLYSSFPSTNGYGIQRFEIPEDAFFVRVN
jgi:hypothetical protein